MKPTQTLLLGGVIWIGAAWLALSADKSSPSAGTKLASPHEAQPSKMVAGSKTAPDFPVIGFIEKRDRTIIVRAGPKGPLYSVKTADGKVVCENLSKEQLTAQAPELGEFLKTAVADQPRSKTDARVRIKVDASLGSIGGR